MDAAAGKLLERYRKGDTNALGELVEFYRRPLYGFILRMTEGDSAAEDIFQDVWLRAIRKIDSFRRGSFLSWLFRIAHNLVIDRARRAGRVLLLDPREGEGAEDTPEGRIADSAPDPSDSVANRDLAACIERAVGQLPLEQREVFLMRFEADLTFREIAAIQRTSINTALARMQYALEKMRNELGPVYRQEVGDHETKKRD